MSGLEQRVEDADSAVGAVGEHIAGGFVWIADRETHLLDHVSAGLPLYRRRRCTFDRVSHPLSS